MTWRARFLALLVVWAIGLALAGVPERATAAESAPTTLTPQQMDALVDKISDAVIAKLQAAGRLSGDAQPSPQAAPTVDADKSVAPSLVQQTETVLAAIPTLPHYLGRLVDDLRDDANGGRSLGNFLLCVVVAVMVALAAEAAIWRAFARLRERLDRRAGAQRGAGSLLDVAGIAVLDGVGVVAVWLVTVAFTRIWFDGSNPQDLLATAVLTRLVLWRVFLWAARIVLRPWAPGARLATLDDHDAQQIYRTLAAIALIVLAVRLVRLNLPPDTPEPTLDAATTVFSLLALALLVLAAFRCRRPIARWFESLAGSPTGPGAVLARHWLWIGVPFFCVLVGAQIYGAITDRVTVPTAVFLTLITVVGLILIETVFKAVSIRLGSPSDPPMPGRPPMPRLIDLVLRCARVAILIGAVVLVAESWVVDVLGLVDPAGWSNLTRSSVVAAVSLFMAYVACEIVRFATDRLLARQVSTGQPGSGIGPSRLATMIPMLRTTLFVLIVCVATLVALSDLGVNITPLIAGASVFGLAISFGSQTLVRDIVSGIFFLADDAFRVGEYIDTGSAKGTVEGFTLRSIRLRHQNGQIHTIPFGTLGKVTNFSRDWSIVKFNMRFTRNTDLEKLRKTVKRIGLEMAEDPELQGDILETLKMQGVADIEENAILVRFKFTARPTRPALVQREAIKRMVKALAAEGIHFAGATPVLPLSGPIAAGPAVAAG